VVDLFPAPTNFAEALTSQYLISKTIKPTVMLNGHQGSKHSSGHSSFSQCAVMSQCNSLSSHLFKTASFVFQLLSGQAPGYLTDDFCLLLNSDRRQLRSSDIGTCAIPRMFTCFSDRSYCNNNNYCDKFLGCLKVTTVTRCQGLVIPR